MFTTITLAVCAFWLLLWSLITHTENLASAMIFKVVPFFMGLACVVAFPGSIGVLSGI